MREVRRQQPSCALSCCFFVLVSFTWFMDLLVWIKLVAIVWVCYEYAH